MELAFRRPGPPLAAHVEMLTYFAGLDVSHQREKLIPDGAIELIVDLGETPKKLYASETSPAAVDFRRAWISGMQRRWIVIEAQPEANLLVIRFRPGGAYALLGHDAATLTDSVFSLEDVLGRAAVSLRDRVLEASTAELRLDAAIGWLAERIGRAALPAALRYLIGRLEPPAGVRIRDLADEVGFTERHMLSLFQRWIGIGPKQYARIRRFQGVLARVSQHAPSDPELRAAPPEPPDWAETAAAFGYADQSHLTHEFRAFAGLTPGQYVAAYRGLTNYLPITLEQLVS
jgi:AraC-like DNA-binding protein